MSPPLPWEPFLLLSDLEWGAEACLGGPGSCRGTRACTRTHTHTHTHTPPSGPYIFPLCIFSSVPLYGVLHSYLWRAAEHKDRVPDKPRLSLPPAGTFQAHDDSRAPKSRGFQPASPDLYLDPTCPHAAVLAPPDWNPDLCLCGNQAQKPAQAAVYRQTSVWPLASEQRIPDVVLGVGLCLAFRGDLSHPD